MPTPLPNPFIDDLAAAAQAMRDALKDEDPRIRIYAARSITLAATHIQRTNPALKASVPARPPTVRSRESKTRGESPPRVTCHELQQSGTKQEDPA